MHFVDEGGADGTHYRKCPNIGKAAKPANQGGRTLGSLSARGRQKVLPALRAFGNGC